MADVRVRPVQFADVEGVRDCVGAVAREGLHLAVTEPFTLVETALYVARLIEAGHPDFVAEDAGRIVGFCDVAPKAGAVYRHVGVLGMGVAASHRRRGIGLKLISASLAAARPKCEQVELSVYASNVAAQALYRKVGFVERGRLPRGRKVGDRYDDVIVMTLIFGNEP
jgi:ribosomal protein S18 acetylase RimI-like enzyme